MKDEKRQPQAPPLIHPSSFRLHPSASDACPSSRFKPSSSFRFPARRVVLAAVPPAFDEPTRAFGLASSSN